MGRSLDEPAMLGSCGLSMRHRPPARGSGRIGAGLLALVWLCFGLDADGGSLLSRGRDAKPRDSLRCGESRPDGLHGGGAVFYNGQPYIGLQEAIDVIALAERWVDLKLIPPAELLRFVGDRKPHGSGYSGNSEHWIHICPGRWQTNAKIPSGDFTIFIEAFSDQSERVTLVGGGERILDIGNAMV